MKEISTISGGSEEFHAHSEINSCHHSLTLVDLRVFQLCYCKSDKDLFYYRIINHQHRFQLNPTSSSTKTQKKRCLFNCVS